MLYYQAVITQQARFSAARLLDVNAAQGGEKAAKNRLKQLT